MLSDTPPEELLQRAANVLDLSSEGLPHADRHELKLIAAEILSVIEAIRAHKARSRAS